ncbi:peptidase C10 domain protein [Segatella baroniae F0067]|uniref:Peptidase C10 domain protein n=1 Tax=Segatella baroniae F0067 TaxID=1115809 RepID=U2QIT2_9BACT|nr:C10 family peptidase [Segatella baroniae]ERK38727.1 peptidase C10 domain protein [Segatella baroniae F0067]
MVGPLVDCFDYDPEMLSFQSRANHTLAAWQNLITNELVAKRPVFYEAYGRTSDGGQDGHAFVLDGVDTQGRYHVNWGWAGDQDGWFNIDAMIGDGVTWNIQPNVLVGIMPNNNKSDDKPVVSLLSMTRREKNDPSIEVNGERDDEYEPFSGTLHFVLENRTSKAFSGYVAAGVSNGDGTFTVISDKKQVEVAAMVGKAVSEVSVDLTFNHAFAEGSTLIHGLVSYDGTNWVTALKNDEYGIEVNATDTKLSGSWNVQTATFKTENDSYALEVDKPTKFVLTIGNKGRVKEVKNHLVWVYWLDTANSNNYGTLGYGYFYTGEILPRKAKKYTFTYTPTATGTYILYTYDTVTGEYCDTKEFTVTDATAINGVETNGTGVFGGDGNVIVKGMAGRTVRIYSADGRLVKQVQVKGNDESIAVRQGLYIVNGTKVLVR